MKVAFVGNQGNNAYRLAGWLRQAGVDAHVFLLKRDTATRSLPHLIDRGLEAGRSAWPEWLHEFDDTYARSWMPVRNPAADPIEADFDVIVTSGMLGLMAVRHFRRLPVVHLSLGSEVTQLPMLLFRRAATPRQRWAALLARRALARTAAVITAYRATVETLARLGHLSKTRLLGFPEDLQRNRDRVDQQHLAELNARYGAHDAVFLWLSRLNFRDPAAPEYKGADRFLEALTRIVRDGRHDIRAIVGRHGADVEAFCERVQDAGLTGVIDFVPHLPYWQVLTYLSLKNALVFDLLGVEKGTLGGLTREALSVNALLVMAVDRESMDVFYGPNCPILEAGSADACYAAMRRVLDMTPAERDRQRQSCADWAARCVAPRAFIDPFLRVLGEAIYGVRVRQSLAS